MLTWIILLAQSVNLTTYKGDWDYFNHFRVFSIHLLGLFTFLLKQNQGSISNKETRMAKGWIIWSYQPYNLAFCHCYVMGWQWCPTLMKLKKLHHLKGTNKCRAYTECAIAGSYYDYHYLFELMNLSLCNWSHPKNIRWFFCLFGYCM